MKWVNKGAERGETLVSISTDGRVVEWSMKKGLSFSPLMVLKRIGQSQLSSVGALSAPIYVCTPPQGESRHTRHGIVERGGDEPSLVYLQFFPKLLYPVRGARAWFYIARTRGEYDVLHLLIATRGTCVARPPALTLTLVVTATEVASGLVQNTQVKRAPP